MDFSDFSFERYICLLKTYFDCNNFRFFKFVQIVHEIRVYKSNVKLINRRDDNS